LGHDVHSHLSMLINLETTCFRQEAIIAVITQRELVSRVTTFDNDLVPLLFPQKTTI